MPIEDGASQVKISGRKGTTVSVQQFLENMEEALREKYGEYESITAVRNGAIKFELLKYDTYQDVVFDLDAALDIHGISGPYVQYASTRAKSVLAKAAGIKAKMGSEPLPESEKIILRKLYRFPEIVATTLTDLAPHYLCLYLFELSQAWNAFYNENRIIGSEREDERLLLTKSIARVLENGLGLLGIEAPEKM